MPKFDIMSKYSRDWLYQRLSEAHIVREGEKTTVYLPDDIPIYLQCVLVNEALRRAGVRPVELLSVEIVED